MATAPSPNDLTRQQLDELDALLQRMLSVPLTPPDTPLPPRGGDGGVPLPPSWRIDSPLPAGPAPHAIPNPPAAPKLEFPAAPPSVPAPKPPPAVVPPVPKPAAKPAPPPAAKTVPSAAPAPVASPTPPVPPVPIALLPLVAFNAVFDAACGVLGPPGRLLRSGLFKHVCGLVGVVLLAYTAAHVAQVRGWLALPIALPWPR